MKITEYTTAAWSDTIWCVFIATKNFLSLTAHTIAHQKAANSYSGEREACVSKRNGDRTKGNKVTIISEQCLSTIIRLPIRNGGVWFINCHWIEYRNIIDPQSRPPTYPKFQTQRSSKMAQSPNNRLYIFQPMKIHRVHYTCLKWYNLMRFHHNKNVPISYYYCSGT